MRKQQHYLSLTGAIALFIYLPFISANAGFFDRFEWTEVNNGDGAGASTIWEPRAGLQAVQLRGKFYVLGGRKPQAPPQTFGDSIFFNDTWVSEDSGNTWEDLSDNTAEIWAPRAYFQAVTKGKYMYVLGGQDSKTNCLSAFGPCFLSSTFFNDVWRSKDGVTWQEMTSDAKWEARAGLSAVTHRGWLYVMGGSVNDDSAITPVGPARVYFNDVYRSRDGRNWQKVTSNAGWEPRAGSVVVSRGKYMYLLGGEDGFVCNDDTARCPPYYNDVWRSKDGRKWTEVTADAGWSPRPGHQCEVLFGYFICFGGFGLSDAALQPPPTGPFPVDGPPTTESPFPAEGPFPAEPAYTGENSFSFEDELFAPSNPVDIWISADGASWRELGGTASPPWNAVDDWNVPDPAQIKYDFAAFPVYFVDGKFKPSIFTFGGDRETFDPRPGSEEYLNVDNDVWRFSPEWRQRRSK